MFLPVFLRTACSALEVAVISVAFGYPVAYLLAALQGPRANTR